MCGEPSSFRPTARKRASSRVVERPPCPRGNADVLLRDHEPHGAPVGHEPQMRRHDRDEPLALARGLGRRDAAIAVGVDDLPPLERRDLGHVEHVAHGDVPCAEVEPRVLVDREVAERVRHRDRGDERPPARGSPISAARNSLTRGSPGVAARPERRADGSAACAPAPCVSAVRARSRLPAQAAIAPRCHESCGSIVPRRFASFACGRAWRHLPAAVQRPGQRVVAVDGRAEGERLARERDDRGARDHARVRGVEERRLEVGVAAGPDEEGVLDAHERVGLLRAGLVAARLRARRRAARRCRAAAGARRRARTTSAPAARLPRATATAPRPASARA